MTKQSTEKMSLVPGVFCCERLPLPQLMNSVSTHQVCSSRICRTYPTTTRRHLLAQDVRQLPEPCFLQRECYLSVWPTLNDLQTDRQSRILRTHPNHHPQTREQAMPQNYRLQQPSGQRKINQEVVAHFIQNKPIVSCSKHTLTHKTHIKPASKRSFAKKPCKRYPSLESLHFGCGSFQAETGTFPATNDVS